MTIPLLIPGGRNTWIAAFLFLFLFLFATIPLLAQADLRPHPVTVKRGQVLELSLSTSLDMGRAALGDDVAFALVRPLVADGATILPPASIIHAYIFRFSHVGKDCVPGGLDFKLDSIATQNGENIKVRFIDKDQAMAGGKLLEQVPLKDIPMTHPLSGLSRVLGHLTTPLLIASPILIPAILYLSAKGECREKRGPGKVLPADTRFYLAVERDTELGNL